jgi:hypothetical protein
MTIDSDQATDPSLLSFALAAYIIEYDNEFEHRMGQAMAASTGSARRYAASMVMWANLMRFVRQEGITVAELESVGCPEPSALSGLTRWGYILAAPDPKRIRRESVIRPTVAGLVAQEVWGPLYGEIEERWHVQFGRHEVEALRHALLALAHRLDVSVSGCLRTPTWSYRGQRHRSERPLSIDPAAQLPAPGGDRFNLPALLSEALLAFTTEFEQEFDLSLAVCANVLRVLGEEGVPVRDLPRLSGVSKEVHVMALHFLSAQGYAFIEPASPARSGTKTVRLTEKGQTVQSGYLQRVTQVENRWKSRYADEVQDLREALEPLVSAPPSGTPPLFACLVPYPGGWRASVPPPETLPHYPVVLLHRGGYPDGA